MASPQQPEPGHDERATPRERPVGDDGPVAGRGETSPDQAATGPPASPEGQPAAGAAAAEVPVVPEQQRDAGAHAAAMAELEDRWRRALADLDNLRKRSARELERERATERARVAGAFLPVLDNLDLALQHAGAEPDPIVAGVRAVRDQAVDVLARLGFPRQEEVGVPFDPVRHEVVSVVDDPETAQGTVVRVTRPGYGQGERQLRPMAVTVARGRE
jgi:molecular chaperone GrpE